MPQSGRLLNLPLSWPLILAHLILTMLITLTPRRLAQAFSAVVGCLVMAHIAIQTVRFVTGNDYLLGLVPLFSVGSDGNLPTFYSAVALLFCAVLLMLIGIAARGDRHIHIGYWFGLATIFLFLSIDEMLALHEHLIEPLRAYLNTSGLFYYAWVIPYGLAVLVFAAVYFRFLFRLPPRTRVLFVAAGVTFVGGAIGVEMIGGLYYESYGGGNVIYITLQTLEELLEMAAIVIFIYALAEYIGSRFGELRLSISPSGAGAGEE